jgi:hypothetical protein
MDGQDAPVITHIGPVGTGRHPSSSPAPDGGVVRS